MKRLSDGFGVRILTVCNVRKQNAGSIVLIVIANSKTLYQPKTADLDNVLLECVIIFWLRGPKSTNP